MPPRKGSPNDVIYAFAHLNCTFLEDRTTGYYSGTFCFGPTPDTSTFDCIEERVISFDSFSLHPILLADFSTVQLQACHGYDFSNTAHGISQVTSQKWLAMHLLDDESNLSNIPLIATDTIIPGSGNDNFTVYWEREQ